MFVIDTSRFYAVAILTNPVRYQARLKLYREFEHHVKDLGMTLVTVEIAFGDRPHVMTEPDDPWDIQLRTGHELWLKECGFNIAFQHILRKDPQAKYFAWIDADVHFQRRDIVMETVHQLQHYDVVQMFSHCIDMGPQMEPLGAPVNGFMWSYVEGGCRPPGGAGYTNYYGYPGPKKGSFWHPGYAWAATRSALEKVPLFDKAILGSADHHMAMGLIGCADRSIPQGVTTSYRNAVMNWQHQATFNLLQNVGYVPGLITHYWHGSKQNRKYVERWKILIDNQYDPLTDITRDLQGLYQLTYHHGPRSIRLRDQIRGYFRARNEDSVDVS